MLDGSLIHTRGAQAPPGFFLAARVRARLSVLAIWSRHADCGGARIRTLVRRSVAAKISLRRCTARLYFLADAGHPRGSVSVDFDRRLAGAQDIATVAARKRRSAMVTISATGADVTTPDRLIPTTCRLTFTAESQTAGNVDPNPADNLASVELQLLDDNDF